MITTPQEVEEYFIRLKNKQLDEIQINLEDILKKLKIINTFIFSE
jgi:predicted RNA-binding protein